jgi:hypothetical protein
VGTVNWEGGNQLILRSLSNKIENKSIKWITIQILNRFKIQIDLTQLNRIKSVISK